LITIRQKMNQLAFRVVGRSVSMNPREITMEPNMPNVASLTEKLGAFRLFEGLTPEQLVALDPYFEERVFKQNERLTEFDQIDKKVFFLVSGRVQVSVPHVSTRRDEFLCELRDGDTVGEFLLARSGRRTASCLAYSDVDTLVADGSALSQFLRDNTEIGAKVFFNLSSILADRLMDNNLLVRRVLASQ
jgi:CRP-like cAMP-binding protein